MDFIEDSFNKELFNNVTNETFKSMDVADKEFLHKLLIKTIIHIVDKFKISKKQYNTHKEQLRANSYRDSIALLLLLLPFIDDPNGDKKRNIKKIEDIYHVKKKDEDINLTEPKYEYSNIQYGRCIRGDVATEIKFSREHILDNYQLLKNTITKIKHKMFVNWINIFPLSITNNEAKINLIKETENKIRRLAKNLNLTSQTYISIKQKEELEGDGVNFEDIYNFYSNYLFNSIKNYKWLIYDVYHNNIISPYYVVLQKLLDLTKCIKGVSYNELTDEHFNNSWDNLKNCIAKNSSCNGIPINIYYKIVVSMMYFFNKYYKNISLAKSDGYIPFIANYLEEDQENIDRLRMNYVWKSINSLNVEHLYEFIRYQFKAYKDSVYSTIDHRTMVKDGLIHSYEDFYSAYKFKLSVAPVINGKRVVLTDKNIYNFAKSLTHKQIGQDYISLGKVWDELTDDDKLLFFKRLQSGEWFNIKGNLKRLGISSKNLDAWNERLVIKLHNDIPKTVVSGLIKKGILSGYVPNPDTSNKDYNLIPKDVDVFFKKNREYLKGCFHFCTNSPYSEHFIETENGKMDYFKFMAEYQKWYTTYAMNWVSQISFFHRYLNCRVMMVTGSTGVGKSTQIPKLLLYALKAIDYNEKGRTICTQPRISAAEGNAKWIALELGIPIEVYNKKYKRYVPERNFNLQFKHQEKSHTLNEDILTLRVCTDGTLMTELKNPLLKKRLYDNKKNDYEYFEDNIYDTIIVDEAHEHNTNMDLILTMMKYTIYHNNRLRLVIVSATMDEDEPIYRRYYRNINDNLLYPINRDIEKFNLDRINVDRRLHISPPSGSTKFKIDEIYKPDADPISITLSLVHEHSFGDILLFQPGEKDIRGAIETLNKTLPENTIAIPFISKMKEAKKDMVKNIEFNKHKLNRNLDFDYFFDDDEVKGGGISRVVIVSTNIAEASITIGSLKYVIDTGLEKIAKYDYKSGETSLITRSISESSRLQRKGRVGRTTPGTVVYTYNKGSKEDIKSPFKISVSDISSVFFNLLKEKPDESEFVTPRIDTTYIGNLKHYDYGNDIQPDKLFKTGYNIDTILDRSGTFYIVHPDELNFKRNIQGNIVKILNDDIKLDRGLLYSQKLDSFIDKLITLWCVVRNDNTVFKTNFGIYLFKLKERLKIDDPRSIVCYIFSRQYNVTEEIKSIIAIIEVSKAGKMPLSRWFKVVNKNGFYQNQFIKYQKTYSSASYNSDLIGLHKILTKIVKLKPIDIKNEKDFEKAYELKCRYINNEDVPFRDYIIFRNMEIKGHLVKKNILTKNEKKILINDDNRYSNDIDEYENLANLYNLDVSAVSRYRQVYWKLQNEIFKKVKDIGEINLDERNDDIDLEWFDKKLHRFKQNYATEDGIVRSLLHGYNSLCFHVKNNFYCDLNYPDLSSLVKIKLFHPKLKALDCFINRSSLVLYFFKDPESSDIFCLTSVSAKQIMETNPINYSETVLKDRLNRFRSINWAKYSTAENEKKQLILISKNLINRLTSVNSSLNSNKNELFWDKVKDIVEKDYIKYIKKAFKFE